MTRSDTTLDPTWTYDFLSGPTAAREVLDDLAARSSAANHSSGLQTDLQIVLAEVLNNVVEHAYGEIPGKPIQLAVTDRRDSVAVHVCDHGVSMPNGTLPGASFPALPAVDLPEGGFALAE